jgi:hypothetical protein
MSEGAARENPKPPAVDRLALLWRRISDHKMVEWGVGYVALAYGIQHGVTLTSEAFECRTRCRASPCWCWPSACRW